MFSATFESSSTLIGNVFANEIKSNCSSKISTSPFLIFGLGVFLFLTVPYTWTTDCVVVLLTCEKYSLLSSTTTWV